MFIKRNTSEEERIKNLFKPDCECIEYFKIRCRQEDLHIQAVEVRARGVSNVIDVPSLTVYVEYPADYNLYGPRNGGVFENIGEIIKALWLETCINFNLKLKKYYTDLWLSLELVHHEFYSYFVRKYKQELTHEISKIALCNPQYVFASSSGYMAIVFNENDLQPFDIWRNIISNQVIKYIKAKSADIIGNINLLPIEVSVYHKGMKDLNLYGLSRED